MEEDWSGGMYVYKRTESLTYQSKEPYLADLCHKLFTFHETGYMCDVELDVGNHVVHAHRVVLAVRSSYFQAMFSNDFQERYLSRIDLSDSIQSKVALKAIIDFMYTGQLTLTPSNVEDILGAASLLMMDTVKNHCSQYMLTNLSPINCVHIWALADMYNLKSLAVICKAMACSRFRDFIRHRQNFLVTPSHFMMKIIKEGVMDFLASDELKALISQWLEFCPSNRFHDCIQILSYLKQQRLIDDDVRSSHMAQYFRLPQLRHYLSSKCDVNLPCSPSSRNKVLACWFLYTRPGDSLRPDDPPYSQMIQMHFYVTNRSKWYTKELELPGELRAKEYIGCMKDILIFQLEYDEILMCFCAGETVQWKKAPNKVQLKHRGLLRAYDDCFRVFDGKLFHTITYIGPIGSSNQVVCTVKVMYLETATESWRQIAFEQFTETKSRSNETVHLKVYSSTDSLFILLSEDHKFGKISRKSDNKYRLEFLSRPAFASKFADVSKYHITQCEQRLVVLPEYIGRYGVYDIATDHWEIHNRLVQPTPPEISLPLDNSNKISALIPVDMDMIAPVESIESHFYEQGYIYINALCPYVCKMWKGAGDLSETASFVWSELTPPSSEKVREFWVCEMSNAALECMEVITYPDQSEVRGQSPMAHYRLKGHVGHTQSAHPIQSSCHFTDSRLAPYDEEPFNMSAHSGSGTDGDEDMDNSSDSDDDDDADVSFDLLDIQI